MVRPGFDFKEVRMKVKAGHELKQFKQINLELTIESQEEFDMVYFLFNYAPICDVMNDYAGIQTALIRREMDKTRTYDPGTFETLIKLFEARFNKFR